VGGEPVVEIGDVAARGVERVSNENGSWDLGRRKGGKSWLRVRGTQGGGGESVIEPCLGEGQAVKEKVNVLLRKVLLSNGRKGQSKVSESEGMTSVKGE